MGLTTRIGGAKNRCENFARGISETLTLRFGEGCADAASGISLPFENQVPIFEAVSRWGRIRFDVRFRRAAAAVRRGVSGAGDGKLGFVVGACQPFHRLLRLSLWRRAQGLRLNTECAALGALRAPAICCETSAL